MLFRSQKETRKKLIENQYQLKGIVSKIKLGLETPTLSETERNVLKRRIDELEQDGDYKDILAIVELGKSESFKEFKALVKSQEQEMARLKLEEGRDIKKMSETQLQENLRELEEQLNLIEKSKQEYFDLDNDKEELEGSHVILTGLQRTLMLNFVMYYEMFNKFAGGGLLDEDARRVINDVHYNIEHNLPVLKDVRLVHVASVRVGARHVRI